MLSQRENVNFRWINHIKSIFDHVGLSYVWNQQNPIRLVELKRTKRDHSYIKMTTSIGTQSISPYDIKLGVLVLILRIFLQNCKRIFSNTCTFSPKIKKYIIQDYVYA
jgi:hypothetical protein